MIAPARLLSATTIERMAVISGVTVMPNARIAGVALTGFLGYKTVAAMGEALELDCGKRVLRRQESGCAHKNDEPLFHIIPHASWSALYSGGFRSVHEFSARRGVALVLQGAASAEVTECCVRQTFTHPCRFERPCDSCALAVNKRAHWQGALRSCELRA